MKTVSLSSVCPISSHKSVGYFATSWTIAFQAPLSLRFSRPEYWSELSCPPPGDLPHSRIKPESRVSPALQADSLHSEPSGRETHEYQIDRDRSSLSLLQGTFPTQESNQASLHCRQILYQLRYQGSHSN